MNYKLFYTDYPVSEAIYRANKAQYMTFNYSELDDALGMARKINKRGGVAWEIEGDDGTHLQHDEIEKTIRVRSLAFANRPKVH